MIPRESRSSIPESLSEGPFNWGLRVGVPVSARGDAQAAAASASGAQDSSSNDSGTHIETRLANHADDLATGVRV
jgi:hypothetical protein